MPCVTHTSDFRTDDVVMFTFTPIAVAFFVFPTYSAMTRLFVLVPVCVDRVWQLLCI